jgi:Undecaprenyl-phosphate glucose phosphotransferase
VGRGAERPTGGPWYNGAVKKQHQILQILFMTADALAVSAAWLLSYLSRFTWEIIPITRGVPSFSLYAGLLVIVVPMWLVFFRFSGLYSLQRGMSGFTEVFNVIKGGTLATLFLVSMTFFYREQTFSRAVIILFWIGSLTLVITSRLILQHVLAMFRRRGINIRRIIVVGSGVLAEMVAEKIDQFPGLGLRIEGYIDAGNGAEKTDKIRPRIIGGPNDLLSIVRDRKIDQIIIALPRDAHLSLEKVLKILENEMVDIKVVPDLLQFVVVKTGLEELDGIPIINLSDTPLSGWYGPVKRVADIVFSTAGLIILSPLLALIAAAIRLTSPGPILYKQTRIGLDGSIFTMYKFRSMRVDAEQETGAVWASENDPRRTKLGAFLRRTSLDELPQLLNVFKGEMSFVGPRPERPIFVEQFREQIPRYMLRHKVKCGLTGWAQVNGYRGNTSLIKRLEFDIFYIENWSLSFDIKIIWLTIWKGLINRHAY